MLQIITGKFFTSDQLYRTPHRGVLYTNYRCMGSIETVVGTYSPADSWRDVRVAIYEVEERLEALDRNGQQSVLVSVGGEHLIHDFAAVLTFTLRSIFSPDIDLVRRLTQSSHQPMGVRHRPRSLLRRVFDAEVDPAADDADNVRRFLHDLIGLERHAFNAAMRAIRRYVTALHRVGDDLEVAYTLLVASIESLAQEYDRFEPDWSDLDQRRRSAMDKALDGAHDDVALRVRTAFLGLEHAALARRFREFALAHLSPRFFREEALAEQAPARRVDLPKALNQAYQVRSRHVHTLRELPRLLTVAPAHTDMMLIEGKPVLTLHGIARMARHVIIEFVSHGAKVEVEEVDYRAELPNVVTAQMAARYWIWRRERFSVASARRYFNGFLTELSAAMLQVEEGALTDVREVLAEVEELAPGLSRERRLPMLAFYLLFHNNVVPELKRAGYETFIERYLADFDEPSLESLVAHVVQNQNTGWSAEQLDDLRKQYVRQRHHKDGLHAGPLFETAITLTVAEAFRAVGDLERAKELVSSAVEDRPGDRPLLEFEKRLSGDSEMAEVIDWTAVLLRPRA